ncbi:Alpha/Beta hydrolase protein [Neurospora tetraspora]|uniref:Alpha/Beta hydrolase protein n=1 Tax=Neurospora tetraspora TaxID=94610 RepID=A0AAE0JJQ8_9PEZI|nr:Alpha/Beta hydrolase protein [Neurospora tetraspora]
MPQTRIPQPEDFEALKSSSGLHVSLHYPTPPESTTSILLLFHGLGDSDAPFLSFARNLSLPGVLAISVRGIAPLPPSLLGLPLDSGPTNNFHWGDDLKLDGRTGEIDMDSGYEKVWEVVMNKLIGEVLMGKCGWELGDVLLFGFGQGGGVALGLGSKVRIWEVVGGDEEPKVREVKEGEEVKEGVVETTKKEKAFKGIVSIGGALPPSMIPSISAREKAKTPVLVLHGSESEYVGEDEVDLIKREFENVKVVEWKRPDDGMPRSREEVLPMMEFFAERLKSGWP